MSVLNTDCTWLSNATLCYGSHMIGHIPSCNHKISCVKSCQGQRVYLFILAPGGQKQKFSIPNVVATIHGQSTVVLYGILGMSGIRQLRLWEVVFPIWKLRIGMFGLLTSCTWCISFDQEFWHCHHHITAEESLRRVCQRHHVYFSVMWTHLGSGSCFATSSYRVL